MLITALAILGAALMALALLIRSKWAEPRLVLSLAGLAVAQASLGYLWKSDARAWAGAYERDIQRCQQPFQRQSQLPPGIQSRLPKTYFCDQEHAEWTPFVQARPVLHLGDYVLSDARSRNDRNTSIDASATSSEVLRLSFLPTSPRIPSGPRSDLIEGDLNYHINGHPNTSPTVLVPIGKMPFSRRR